MTVEELEKFKKYHRYGEIKFAIAELEKVKTLLFSVGASQNVIDCVYQRIEALEGMLYENKN